MTAVTPSTGVAGLLTTVSLSGSTFLPGAAVFLDEHLLQTTFVDQARLTAFVPLWLPAGTYTIRVRNPGSDLSQPVVGAFTLSNQAAVLHVPLVQKDFAGRSTSIHVQNTSASATIVQVLYYDMAGSFNPGTLDVVTVPAGASVNLAQVSDSELPSGFDGSAVIQSNLSIRAIVNHTSSAAANASAGGFVAPLSPGTQATLPVVFGGFNGYRTTISVQNTGSRIATFATAFFPTGSTVPIAVVPRAIPPRAASRLRVGADFGAPPSFVGTAVVSSTDGQMVVVADTLHESTGVMLSYGGIAAGANTQNAPLLFKNAFGWVSGAQVTNVSTAPVVVNAILNHRDSALSYTLPARPLAPNESFTYYLPALTDLPDGFVGAGVFAATGAIALVVQEVNAARGTGMAYSGFGAGSPNVSVPLTMKSSDGWDTGIQTQNVGTTETIVTVVHHRQTGVVAVEAASISPGESRTFYQPTNAELPAGHSGSALVSSNNGQPIVAIVNQVNYSRRGDGSMAYEGINY